MRVLQICCYFYPHIGGIEQVAKDVSVALSENEKCVQKILCFNHEKNDVTEWQNGIEIVRVGTFLKLKSQALSMSYGKILKKVCNEFRPEVVIFHYPNPFLAHGLLKILRRINSKLILYWHLDITRQKILGKIFHRQTLKLLQSAERIVATSPNYIAGSPYLSEFRHKCTIIPCCVSDERLIFDQSHFAASDTIRRLNDGKIICFAFGRHVPYKGLEYLIKAAGYLPENFKIYIGGSGPLTGSLRRNAADERRIEFIGRISDKELKAYFLACDIFCFPSITKNEAFGIGLAEAMFYGKPSITFTIAGSGVNFVSKNGETGIEVENRNAEKYAEAIIALASDHEKRKEFGENAKKRARDNFSEKLFNERILELIREVST